MRTSIAVAVAVAALAGCGKQLNPEYCAQFGSNDPDCQNGGLVVIDAPPPCMQDMDCKDPTRPACDTTQHECVQCWTSAHAQACMAPTPVCGSDDQCHGCIVGTNDGCVSGQICLPSGTCADPTSDILYVSMSAPAGAPCTMAAKCRMADAVTKLDMGMGHAVEIDDGNYTDGPYMLTPTGSVVIFSSSGTPTSVTFTSASGSVFTVQTATGTISLQHLSIINSQGDGITCNQGTVVPHDVQIYGNQLSGIYSTGCTVVLDRSRIHDNKVVGLDLGDSPSIWVRNNLIYNNGSGGSRDGGVTIHGATTGKLKFNTITGNHSKSGNGVGGLYCHAGLVNATSNIVTGNQNAQIDVDPGTCQTSPIYDLGPAGVFGTDYHLAAHPPSGIVDNPSSDCSDVPDDFDGDMRPNHTYCDLGADEK